MSDYCDKFVKSVFSTFSYNPPCSNVNALIINHAKTFMYILWSENSQSTSKACVLRLTYQLFTALDMRWRFHPSKCSRENQTKYPEVPDERMRNIYLYLASCKHFSLYQNQNGLYCQVCLHIRGISFRDRSYLSATKWQWQDKNTDNKKNEKEQVNKE